MVIPNGLTLEMRNSRSATLAVGNTILSGNEQDFVHFETTAKLKQALQFQKQGWVQILTEIPQAILDQLNEKSPSKPTNGSGTVPRGPLYRDEFEKFRQEILEKNNLTMAPQDKSVTYEKLNPDVYGFNNNDLTIVYTDDQVREIVETDGSAVKSMVGLSYHEDGSIATITEVRGKQKVTKTLVYQNGEFVGMESVHEEV